LFERHFLFSRNIWYFAHRNFLIKERIYVCAKYSVLSDFGPVTLPSVYLIKMGCCSEVDNASELYVVGMPSIHTSGINFHYFLTTSHGEKKR